MEAEMTAKGYNFSGLEKMAQNRVRETHCWWPQLHPGVKGNDDDDEDYFLFQVNKQNKWLFYEFSSTDSKSKNKQHQSFIHVCTFQVL